MHPCSRRGWTRWREGRKEGRKQGKKEKEDEEEREEKALPSHTGEIISVLENILVDPIYFHRC